MRCDLLPGKAIVIVKGILLTGNTDEIIIPDKIEMDVDSTKESKCLLAQSAPAGFIFGAETMSEIIADLYQPVEGDANAFAFSMRLVRCILV